MTRVLALDYGSARCGCAVSDPSGTLATPLAAVPRPASDKGIAALASLVRESGAERVVVGLPLTMSGEEGAQAEETRRFAARLGASIAVDVELYDERLTTRQAARSEGVAGEDSRAAAHLLEGYLASSPHEQRA